MQAYQTRDTEKLKRQFGQGLKAMLLEEMTGPRKMERWPPLKSMKTQRRQEAQM